MKAPKAQRLDPTTTSATRPAGRIRQRPARGAATGLAGCLIMMVTAVHLGADTTGPAKPAALSSDDQALWVVVSDWDPENKQTLNWLAHVDPTSLTVSALPLAAQLGEVRASATVNGSLHLFLSNQDRDALRSAHYAYSATGGDRRHRRLPGDALPRVMAGGNKTLWAIVSATTAKAVADAWFDHLKSQAVEAEEPAQPSAPTPSTSRPVDLAPDRAYVVKYDGQHWQLAFAAPAELTAETQAWLVVSGEKWHLFSAAPGDDTVRYDYCGADHRWIKGPAISFEQRVSAGFAGILNTQLVFAAFVADPAGGDPRCEPRVLAPDASAWLVRPALKAADGSVVTFSKSAVIGGLRDKLAILRPSAKGVEVCFWSPNDGHPIPPVKEVPIRKGPTVLPSTKRTRDQILLFVVMAIILAVYWLRRDSIGSPALMPPGPTPASYGRRALAAALDMAPGAGIVLAIWWEPIGEYVSEVQIAMDRSQAAPAPTALTWPWFTLVGIHSLYCTLFELRGGLTPGKRLARCIVVSESIEKPTPMQILVRNASRLLEMEPHLGLWPFLLVMFMTRNRQRVGDMLARTFVVESGWSEPQDEDTDERGAGPRPPPSGSGDSGA